MTDHNSSPDLDNNTSNVTNCGQKLILIVRKNVGVPIENCVLYILSSQFQTRHQVHSSQAREL